MITSDKQKLNTIKDSAVLYQAEGHPDRLMPGIGKTAKVIGTMYGFFLFIGSLSYTIFGMPFFDSVVHTMCALSTGGFSNRMDSIGYYHSLPIECITVILMLIGTTNLLQLAEWKHAKSPSKNKPNHRTKLRQITEKY